MAADAEPKLPPRWGEVLARVEQALAAAVEAAGRREQALQEMAASAPPAAVDLTEGLARFRERLRGLAECAARAEQTVAASDAELAAGEEALRAWLQGAEAARRKLAAWAGKA
jgi:hypothetical protein